MRKFIILFLIAAILVTVCGCTSQPAAPPKPSPALIDRVAALEVQVNQISQTDSKTKITTLETTTGKLSDFITTINGQITALNSKLGTQSTPTNMATKEDIAVLNSKIADINSKPDNSKDLDALKKQLADLTAKVAELNTKVSATPTPTPTSTNSSNTGTGTATNGQVTASIVSYTSSLYSGMYFNNTNSSSNGILSISPVKIVQYDATTENATTHPNDTLVKFGDSNVPWWVNKTVTSQFQLQINNNTGKTISNIQLGLAFIFIKADGTQINVPYAPDGSFSLSSMGNPQWTNTGSDASYASWTTGAANSIIANLWNFSQQPGTSTYYSTLTYTLPTYTAPNSAPSLPTGTFYAVPMLKIVGYNIN